MFAFVCKFSLSASHLSCCCPTSSSLAVSSAWHCVVNCADVPLRNYSLTHSLSLVSIVYGTQDVHFLFLIVCSKNMWPANSKSLPRKASSIRARISAFGYPGCGNSLKVSLTIWIERSISTFVYNAVTSVTSKACSGMLVPLTLSRKSYVPFM